MGARPYIFKIMEEFLGCNSRNGRQVGEFLEVLLMNAEKNAHKFGRDADFERLRSIVDKPTKTKADEVESMVILMELACLEAKEEMSAESQSRWDRMLAKARMEIKTVED